jgi:hypothetical protein
MLISFAQWAELAGCYPFLFYAEIGRIVVLPWRFQDSVGTYCEGIIALFGHMSSGPSVVPRR